jgi:hypothetical protein
MPTFLGQQPNPPITARRSRLLCCCTCGQSEARSPDELFLYARHGRPECCGEVMEYFAIPPEPADTRPTAA